MSIMVWRLSGLIKLISNLVKSSNFYKPAILNPQNSAKPVLPEGRLRVLRNRLHSGAKA